MKVTLDAWPILLDGSDKLRNAALGWVDYCNGTRDTYYANLRRKNGRQEPYNVCNPVLICCFPC